MQTIKLHRSVSHQKGAATLLISIVLLIGVTLIVIFAARVGVMDQRIAGNEYRHKEAKAAADAALEQAAAFISNNTELYAGTTGGTYPWVQCTGALATVFPCQNGGTTYDLAYDGDTSTSTIIESLQDGNPSTGIELPSGVASDSYLTYTTSASVGNILTAIGKGSSLDETGNAYAQISYTQISLLTPGEVPPIMTPTIKLSGSFTIVGDPNGGGTGVPISAWVTSIDADTGSWQTCQLGDFRDGDNKICSDTRDDTITWKDCDCVPDQALSNKDKINYDLVKVDPADFPASTFQYLFPNIADFAQLLTVEGVVELADCSNIVADTSGFTSSTIVAVSGGCSIPADSIIGSRAAPLILVVNGLLKINANADFYGIALGLNDVSLNGTATIHGSLLAEDSTKLTNGGYTQVYDPFVLTSITEDLESFGLAKQKYSWTDIQP